MNHQDAEGLNGDPDVSSADVSEEARRLGRQYGEEYFAQYGRAPFGYQTGAPYRFGELLWEDYFGRIAELIAVKLGARTVLDAGCAIGLLVDALRQRAVEAWGVDISEFAIEQVPEAIRPFCSVGSITDELERDYDLIVCLEMLEHLPSHLGTIAVANLCRHTSAVLFSASPDGFSDPTHLNVQPTDYWVALFGRHGFFRNLDLDASVIAPHAIHFRRAEQTAVSVASAYERWHWRTLTEVRELRAMRQLATEAVLKAERAEAEVGALREQADQAEAESRAAGAKINTLRERLEDREAALRWADAEIAGIRQTRLFRHMASARRLYSMLRQRRVGLAASRVHFAINAPLDGQILESDSLLPVQGWIVCEQDPVARVDVMVNGVDCGRARLGLVRPDLSGAFDTADAPISGFERLVDLRTVPGDGKSVRIELRVETLEGDRHSLGVRRVELTRATEDEEPEKRVPPPRSTRKTTRRADIRLLVFTHDLGFGGGQLYLFELLRLLSRAPDVAATVVAPAEGPLRGETEALGIPVVVNGGHPVASADQYEGRQAELGAWAREGGFNAVLGNTFLSFPGIDLAARLGLPALWAIHESFDMRSIWRWAYGSHTAVHPLVRAHAEKSLASAAAVVFEADATRDLFSRHGDLRRFITIPYGIDVEEIERYSASVSQAQARDRLQLRPEASVLLCMGTIEPRKAQTALAQAFRAVAPTYPDVNLAFVGALSNRSSAGLHKFVHSIGLEDRIRIVPVTPDIYPWYRAADALVCASDVESLPRTVLEAMAFSVPVIATRVFGLPELIDDGVTGYLCEPSDIGALVSVLNRFLSAAAAEREAVGAAGGVLVRDRHNSRGYADAYYRLLRALIEDPTRFPSEILAG